MLGCDRTPKNTGPVKIVKSVFDYHESIELPNGEIKEFYHQKYEGSLSEEGSTVDIRYIGNIDDHDITGGNLILGVKVIKHNDDYIKNHPELWPERKGHLVASHNTFGKFHANYILDESGIICGSMEEKLDDTVSLTTSYDVSRDHNVSRTYEDWASAQQALYKSCR